MACTELFGVITVAFELIGNSEHRLKIFGSFDKKTLLLSILPFLLIKTINLMNKWVWLSGCG